MKKEILNIGKVLNKKEQLHIQGGNPNIECDEGEITFYITSQTHCINVLRGEWCGTGNVCAVCSV